MRTTLLLPLLCSVLLLFFSLGVEATTRLANGADLTTLYQQYLDANATNSLSHQPDFLQCIAHAFAHNEKLLHALRSDPEYASEWLENNTLTSLEAFDPEANPFVLPVYKTDLGRYVLVRASMGDLPDATMGTRVAALVGFCVFLIFVVLMKVI